MAARWQQSDVSGRFHANEQPIDRAIVTVAARQKQLIRLGQLEQLGLGCRVIQHRARQGRLHRTHSGVYATHPPPYSPHQLYLAAVYACGPASFLSDLPAASLHGLTEPAPLPAHVTNAKGAGRSRRAITVHRRKLDPRDTTSRFAIPCTSIARTIIDCAHAAGAEGTEQLIMAADSKQALNRRRLEELAIEHRTRPGIGHILALISDDPVELRSKNERRMFSICRQFGVQLPLCNQRIELSPTRHFIADFCWPDLRLIVEADSWRWHGGRLASESDADRDQLLAIAGWQVVHFTRDQILKRRGETGRRLVALTRR